MNTNCLKVVDTRRVPRHDKRGRFLHEKVGGWGWGFHDRLGTIEVI